MYLKIIDAHGWTHFHDVDQVTVLGWDHEILNGSSKLHDVEWTDVDEHGVETTSSSRKWRMADRLPTKVDEPTLREIAADRQGANALVSLVATRDDTGERLPWAEAAVIVHEATGWNVTLIDREAVPNMLSGLLFIQIVEAGSSQPRVIATAPIGAWLLGEGGRTIDSLLA